MAQDQVSSPAESQSPDQAGRTPLPLRPVFAVVAAALAAAPGDCTCQTCLILRAAAPELASYLWPLPGQQKEDV